MFGMSSKEFWEDDPQLYWSYRTFYLKKMQQEAETINYKSWLNGSYSNLAVSIALNNAFSKKKVEYPKEPYTSKKQKNKQKTKLEKKLQETKDNNIRQQLEFNYWARL